MIKAASELVSLYNLIREHAEVRYRMDMSVFLGDEKLRYGGM